jgi:hypothetical protein
LLRVELDRLDAQHVFPIGLVQQDLAQLVLGRFAGQEEIELSSGVCVLVSA